VPCPGFCVFWGTAGCGGGRAERGAVFVFSGARVEPGDG